MEITRNALLPALLLIGFALSGQSLYQDLTLDYGPYAVGYAHRLETDRTRTYERPMDYADSLTFRPVPVSVWYPRVDTANATRVTILDYLRVLKEEEEWESLPDEYIFSWFYYPETPAAKQNAPAATHAYSDGEMLPGNHPVVIYSPSYNASSAENFVLCEYLASRGYVVFASPSRGARQRHLEGGTTRDAEAQWRDLDFLTGYAAHWPGADADRLFTVGFSFGGLSNILFAMNNPHVDGVISLDGTVKYHPEVPRASHHYREASFSQPFVHFSQKDIPAAVVEADKIDPELGKDFTFFKTLDRAPAYHFQFTDLTHGNFAAFGVLFEPRDPRQDKSNAVINAAYARLCTRTAITLDHMDAYRPTDAVWQSAKYPKAMAGDGVTLLETKVADTKAYTVPQFFALARKDTFTNLPRLYEEVQVRYPEFRLPEGDLNTLGLQLGFAPLTREEGIRIFKFALVLFPDSANLYDSLAEIYLYADRLTEAKAHFEKSLELDPGNGNARRRLREMKP
ncbi:MAG: dienelactone hydrolase family protein [Bacteroidota bacterium]